MSTGFTNPTSDTATTPGRKTHVIFDADERVAVEPIFSQQREWNHIVPNDDNGNSSSTGSYQIELVQGIGWQLAKIHADSARVHEKGAADSDNAGLTVPSGFSLKAQYRDVTELTGVTYSGTTSPGDKMWQRLLAAGGSVTDSQYNFAADQASMPSPTAGSENAQMLRVGIGTNPGAGSYPPYHFRFIVPGTKTKASDNVATFYFNAPAGIGCITGYYSIVFHGDGHFGLFGWSGAAWILLRTSWYCGSNHVCDVTHHVLIDVNQTPNSLRYAGSIQFRFTLAAADTQSQNPGTSFLGVLKQGRTDDAPMRQWRYRIERTKAAIPQPQAPRIDHRSDTSVKFQLAQIKYQTSGTLVDRPFTLPFFLTETSVPFQLCCYGQAPAGTSIVATLWDADAGTALGSANINATPVNITPTTAQNYYVSFAFSGPGNATPTLEGYYVFRDSYVAVVSATSFEVALQPTDSTHLRLNSATGVNITQQGAEPDSGSATVQVIDVNDSMPRLFGRGELPIRIETEYDASDSTKRAVLFRGYAIEPEGEIIYQSPAGGGFTGAGSNTYYGSAIRRYSLNCPGMWQRLSERLTTCRIDWANSGEVDSMTGGLLPYKVTDAINLLLGVAGFAQADINIPDLPIRLFNTDDEGGLMLDPQSTIGDTVKRFALDYLGQYLYADFGYGSYGGWTLLSPPTTPTYLAAFQSGGPGSSKVVNNINSYPVTSTTSGNVPTFPMLKPYSRWRVKRPEANYVVCFGVAEGQGDGDGRLLCQKAYNYKSFRFDPSQPAPSADDPNWIGRPVPVYQYLPSFASSDPNDPNSPINFVTRRVYDVSCTPKTMRKFRAPLALITDPVTSVKRALRFYDYVYVDGDAAIVVSCNPMIEKDDHQMAEYEVMLVVSGQPFHPFGSVYMSARDVIKKIAGRANNETVKFSKEFGAEKRGVGSFTDALGIPAVPLAKLQNADGSFPYMMDYDALP